MQPQIKEAVKERRKNTILEAQQAISAQYLAGMVGGNELVLVDQVLENGRSVGRSQGFAPDVDGVVYLEGYRGAAGQIVRCRIIGSDAYNLSAVVDEADAEKA
jgi:ribosomal protein S12 methylthiotransferase